MIGFWTGHELVFRGGHELGRRVEYGLGFRVGNVLGFWVGYELVFRVGHGLGVLCTKYSHWSQPLPICEEFCSDFNLS